MEYILIIPESILDMFGQFWTFLSRFWPTRLNLYIYRAPRGVHLQARARLFYCWIVLFRQFTSDLAGVIFLLCPILGVADHAPFLLFTPANY